MGALGGAAIVMAFLDLFNVDAGLMRWLLAVVGGVVGLILIRRARKGSQDWGIIILAGLVGALLVMRGLTILLPALQGISGTLIVIVLAGAEYRVPGRDSSASAKRLRRRSRQHRYRLPREEIHRRRRTTRTTHQQRSEHHPGEEPAPIEPHHKPYKTQRRSYNGKATGTRILRQRSGR